MAQITWDYVKNARGEIEGIHVAWSEIERLVGHTYMDDKEAERIVIAALQESGAPDWVADPYTEGWLDEYGWGLKAPQA